MKLDIIKNLQKINENQYVIFNLLKKEVQKLRLNYFYVVIKSFKY